VSRSLLLVVCCVLSICVTVRMMYVPFCNQCSVLSAYGGKCAYGYLCTSNGGRRAQDLRFRGISMRNKEYGERRQWLQEMAPFVKECSKGEAADPRVPYAYPAEEKSVEVLGKDIYRVNGEVTFQVGISCTAPGGLSGGGWLVPEWNVSGWIWKQPWWSKAGNCLICMWTEMYLLQYFPDTLCQEILSYIERSTGPMMVFNSSTYLRSCVLGMDIQFYERRHYELDQCVATHPFVALKKEQNQKLNEFVGEEGVKEVEYVVGQFRRITRHASGGAGQRFTWMYALPLAGIEGVRRVRAEREKARIGAMLASETPDERVNGAFFVHPGVIARMLLMRCTGEEWGELRRFVGRIDDMRLLRFVEEDKEVKKMMIGMIADMEDLDARIYQELFEAVYVRVKEEFIWRLGYEGDASVRREALRF